jgi:hypothetical protein
MCTFAELSGASLARRKNYIFILIILFLLTLTYYTFWPCFSEASQVIASSSSSLHEPPLRDNSHDSTNRHLWLDNPSDIAFLQNATVVIRGRETAKNYGDAKNTISYCYQKTAFGHAIFSFSASSFSAFTTLDSQACLHLDIPPPFNPVYL